jgi:CRP-like cAMP-binding protein
MIPEVAFLKQIYIFQDLNQQELEFVAQVIAPRGFAAGDVIVREGESGQPMYVIAEGEVETSKTLTMKLGEDDFREADKTPDVMRAEDQVVFGEMSLVTDAESSATIVALTDCTLYEITKDNFMGLAAAKPALGFKVTHRLAELVCMRLKKTSEDVIRLTTALSIALSR